jgi:O-antigen ligase
MLTMTYIGVILFCVLYFFRPADFIPGLAIVPLAKFTGAIAFCSLILALLGGEVRFDAEIKLITALFGWFVLTIPFSLWRGGSLETCVEFSKVLVVAVAAIVSVNSLKRLRRLMIIQTFAMILVAVLGFGQARVVGRMFGAGHQFSDPNDLALNLCVILPFCAAMLLSTRNVAMKFFWTAVVLATIVLIALTESRGGFLAVLVVLIAMWRRFRLSGSTKIMAAAVLSIAIIAGLALVGPSAYFGRMHTIMNPDEDKGGSAQSRRAILIESLHLTITHPLFGVGPGQFTEVSGFWHVTHNTYTQFSSETGFPGIVLFILLLRRTFKNLKVDKNAVKTQAWYVTNALYCGMAGYIVGAFFLSTTYWLMPYLMVAYSVAARNIMSEPLLNNIADQRVGIANNMPPFFKVAR